MDYYEYSGYYDKKIINLKKEFTKDELLILKKSNLQLQDKLTIFEYDKLKEVLGVCYDRMYHYEELKSIKPFICNITRDDYICICNQFNRIDCKYEKILNIKFRQIRFDDVLYKEKQHVRDKIINELDNNKLDKKQKEQLLSIIVGIKDVSIIQVQRFVMYYGLGSNTKERYSVSEIAKLQGCSDSNIRQGIRTIKSSLIKMSNEDINVLRNMVN